MDWNQLLHSALNGALTGAIVVIGFNIAALTINAHRTRNALPPLRKGWPFKYAWLLGARPPEHFRRWH